MLYTLDLMRLRAACRAAALLGEPAIEVVNAALLVRTRRVAHVLSAFGAEIGERARIHGPLCIHNASKRGYENLHIGSRAHIGRNVLFDLTCPIVIGAEATISMGVTILTHADVGARELAKRFPRQESETHIGRGAYIGANALILAGCHVGQRSIVGAGAVVTAPISDDTVAVGVPSKVLKATGRNSDEVRCGGEDAYLSSQPRQPAWGEIA